MSKTKNLFVREIKSRKAGVCSECKRDAPRTLGIGEYISGKYNSILHGCEAAGCIDERIKSLWQMFNAKSPQYTSIEFKPYQCTVGPVIRQLEMVINRSRVPKPPMTPLKLKDFLAYLRNDGFELGEFRNGHYLVNNGPTLVGVAVITDNLYSLEALGETK